MIKKVEVVAKPPSAEVQGLVPDVIGSDPPESLVQVVASLGLSPSRIRDRLVSGVPDAPLSTGVDLKFITSEDLCKAEWKLGIVLRFIRDSAVTRDIHEHAARAGVSLSTFYRYLERFQATEGRLEDFLRKNKAVFKPRLTEPVEEIIEAKVEADFLSAERPTAVSVWRKIRDACLLNGLPPPAESTIRLRLKKISLEKATCARFGVKKARDRFSMLKQGFVQQDGPLWLVQIDHTPVDLIVLDEETRLPIGRVYITIVLDTYSRMVLGFCLTLDEPSALSVGIALGHAILPKKPWLDEIGVDAAWPCQGLPVVVFVDNALEFHGKMLRMACLNWRIELQWRPLKRPEFGGHIERFMRTLAQAVHEIPGTTFSNVAMKGDYDSASSACMTIRELEAWVATWITKEYHQRPHQGLGGRPPIRVWEEGLVQAEAVTGKPMALAVGDPQKVRMDLLPLVERTVQQYGCKIFGEFYYHDVLRRFVHTLEPGDSRRKKTYILRYDPRDVSRVYFWDEATGEYWAVPWRDPSRQPCSLWELRLRNKQARDKADGEVDKLAGARARQELDDRIVAAKAMTQKQRRVYARKKSHQSNNIHKLMPGPVGEMPAGSAGGPSLVSASPEITASKPEQARTWLGLKAFSEIE